MERGNKSVGGISKQDPQFLSLLRVMYTNAEVIFGSFFVVSASTSRGLGFPYLVQESISTTRTRNETETDYFRFKVKIQNGPLEKHIFRWLCSSLVPGFQTIEFYWN